MPSFYRNSIAAFFSVSGSGTKADPYVPVTQTTAGSTIFFNPNANAWFSTAGSGTRADPYVPVTQTAAGSTVYFDTNINAWFSAAGSGTRADPFIPVTQTAAAAGTYYDPNVNAWFAASGSGSQSDPFIPQSQVSAGSGALYNADVNAWFSASDGGLRSSPSSPVVSGLDFLLNGLDVLAAYSLRQVVGTYGGDFVALDGNQRVSTWYDQSGNGRNLSQATEDNRLTYVDDVVNGHPILRSNEHFFTERAFPDLDDAFSASIVFSMGEGINQALFEVGAGGINTGLLYIVSGTTSEIFRGRAGGGLKDANGTISQPLAASIVTCLYDADGLTLRRDGAEIETVDSPGTLDNTISNLRALHLQQSGWEFIGDLAELVFSGEKWDSDQYEAIEANQAEYYGISLA